MYTQSVMEFTYGRYQEFIINFGNAVTCRESVDRQTWYLSGSLPTLLLEMTTVFL